MLVFRKMRRASLSFCELRNCSIRAFSAHIKTRDRFKNGPSLKDFIVPVVNHPVQRADTVPYLIESPPLRKQKVYFDVYGCQMNVNDTEIVWSILKDEGFEMTKVQDEADVFLVMTCSIREGAESKIWHRLEHLRAYKRKRAASVNRGHSVKIGILGCMAERLKEKLIEKEKSVDIVAGPDSYRDLPRLLAVTESGQAGVNVLLSLDETYADVVPVRLNRDAVTAFVSIMRGCDNMCTYCIVPFTRGRERSRPAASIAEEVRLLSQQGVREVTLLGQNVNSYRDLSEVTAPAATRLADGFRTVYRNRRGGLRFADLLDKVSSVDPEMRVRFTSPHPKDFPDEHPCVRNVARVNIKLDAVGDRVEPSITCNIPYFYCKPSRRLETTVPDGPPAALASEVLQLISERANVCGMLHLPAQSGSSAVLERMRRGYTRDAYLALVDRARHLIPGGGWTDIFSKRRSLLQVLQLISERANVCGMLHLPAQSGSSAVLERMRRGYTRDAYLALVNRARHLIPGGGWTDIFSKRRSLLQVLQLISERANVCGMLHLPAQSGSSAVLERMRRGYTRDAYLALVDRARHLIPGGGWTDIFSKRRSLLQVLQLISERANVCGMLHLPAQSGSSAVLERMRRGYTRDAYLALVDRARHLIPGGGWTDIFSKRRSLLQVLQLISERANVCGMLHLPAQSGSSAVLERMRRGYTRDAYLALVDRARHLIPGGGWSDIFSKRRSLLQVLQLISERANVCGMLHLPAQSGSSAVLERMRRGYTRDAYLALVDRARHLIPGGGWTDIFSKRRSLLQVLQLISERANVCGMLHLPAQSGSSAVLERMRRGYTRDAYLALVDRARHLIPGGGWTDIFSKRRSLLQVLQLISERANVCGMLHLPAQSGSSAVLERMRRGYTRDAYLALVDRARHLIPGGGWTDIFSKRRSLLQVLQLISERANVCGMLHLPAQSGSSAVLERMRRGYTRDAYLALVDRARHLIPGGGWTDIFSKRRSLLQVLQLISERANVCGMLHLPAQSGSSAVLERMRRGYTRDAYLALVDRARHLIPGGGWTDIFSKRRSLLQVLQLISERANVCGMLHLPAQSDSSAVLERMRRGYTRDAYLALVDRARHLIPGGGWTDIFSKRRSLLQVLQLISERANVCGMLHLPAQSGSSAVLERMRRGYTRDAYLALVDRARHLIPGGGWTDIFSKRRSLLQVLQLISERANVCGMLHLPAQSGSSAVLERMRRGYTRDAYLALVDRARHLIPGGGWTDIFSKRRSLLQVLQLISERANVCGMLHLPAQSGSSAVLERMRRGYTRDAYLALVDRARHLIPGGGWTDIFSKRRSLLQVLQLISERANVCGMLHLPAQSGSSAVLERMRRGYTRDAYLALVDRARHLIPGGGWTDIFSKRRSLLQVLQLISERANVCGMLHLPAQSGSSAVLERMRRGYTRDAYLALVDRARHLIPGVGLSSDFICGFCGETDEEFEETISLIERVGYNVAYLFPYSMREKTAAHRRYADDVPEPVKRERHLRMAEVFRRRAEIINQAEIGRTHLVLIEGRSKRSDQFLAGRNEHNIKVIVPQMEIEDLAVGAKTLMTAGDFVAVEINEANSQVLKGTPLCHSSISSFGSLITSRNRLREEMF